MMPQPRKPGTAANLVLWPKRHYSPHDGTLSTEKLPHKNLRGFNSPLAIPVCSRRLAPILLWIQGQFKVSAPRRCHNNTFHNDNGTLHGYDTVDTFEGPRKFSDYNS